MLIALILIAMFALAMLELWLFWTLGEHKDRGPRPTVDRSPADLSPGDGEGQSQTPEATR